MILLPLFPLQIVVFPGETLPLHIFEKRYRELLSDCEQEGTSFGIPTVLDGKITFGTEIELLRVEERYENGNLDIVCRGKGVFRVERFINPMEDKLYPGGSIQFLSNIEDGTPSQRKKVHKLIKELYHEMSVEMPKVDAESFNSFTLAHKIGMSVKQELELLQLIYESERLKYLISHLKTIIPVIKEVNRTKEIIQLNGHFRSFDPMDFKSIK
ncbi:LON peptidase substrate-binding domain-containing protein [Ascidiimonas aurantiaca]|uniref:LON peptidase substrate-binding domain-containing protein n=1 Tax=Ascidiimonas aurantiaca TaxID=1685432 RepID=UPI0030EB2246